MNSIIVCQGLFSIQYLILIAKLIERKPFYKRFLRSTMDRHSSSIEYELGLAEFAKTIHRNESNKFACPNHPQGLLIDDHHTGDVICTECALVLGEKVDVAIYTPNNTAAQQDCELP